MTEPTLAALTEAFSNGRDGAGTGLILAQIDAALAGSDRRKGAILWVQDARAAQEGGLPCLRGIGETGLRMPILRIAARDAGEALWAMEEGLECAVLSAVVGEIWGNPKALDFTATKRLALRSRRSGVPLWLLRMDGEADLSVVPDRWRVTPEPSTVNALDGRAPGQARWRTELFRTRGRPPGEWVASHDRASHRLHLVAPLSDGTVGESAGECAAPEPRAVGGG